MKLVMQYFDFKNSDWSRLASVWEYSARVHCPDARLIVMVDEAVDPQPDMDRGCPIHTVWNTAKLHRWRGAVADIPDGERVILMDADTLILGDVFEAFDLYPDMEVGVTTRPGRHPYNGGVVFLRTGPAVRRFMDRWVELNDHLMARPDKLKKYRTLHGGVNQGSLAILLDKHAADPFARVSFLPCRRWNSVDQTWHLYDGDAKVVHYKSGMRRLALGRFVDDGSKRVQLAKLWKAYERRALAESEGCRVAV